MNSSPYPAPPPGGQNPMPPPGGGYPMPPSGGGYGPPPGYGQGGYQPQGQPPPSNLVWAILTTILCCLPLGVVSIVYAARVESRWMQGDYQGARESSESAKKFAIYSAVAYGVALLVVIILAFAGVIGGVNSGNFY